MLHGLTNKCLNVKEKDMRVSILFVCSESLNHEWTCTHLGAVMDVLVVVLLTQHLLDASLWVYKSYNLGSDKG